MKTPVRDIGDLWMQRGNGTTVPKKERNKKVPHSKYPEVIKARENMEEGSKRHTATGSEEDRELLKEAKEMLFNAYNKIKDEIKGKMDKIQNLHSEGQYVETWNIVNELYGKIKAKKGLVTGASPEERVSTWFNHFKRQLGEAPNTEGSEEAIPSIFENLQIDDGPFTAEEYTKAKNALKQGKSMGPDNIPPGVFKNCELDDIVLDLCNIALMKNEKPDQWTLFNIIPLPKKVICQK